MIDGEALAVGLGIFSAFTLALANLTVKASADILTVRVVLSMSCAAIVAPALFFVPLPSQDLIIALAISLPIHTAYQFAMIRALQSGDLSLVFPVMRGLAPLLVGIGGILILGETLSPLSTLGLVIATGAVISFGLLQGGGLKGLKHVPPRAMIWASLTACGVMGYTIADARGVRLAENPFTFITWLFFLDWIGVTLIALFARRGKLFAQMMPVFRHGILGGALSVVSFGAALYAVTLIEAARVSALRESAVIFGALFGWLILKEGLGPRRLVAAIVLLFGLTLMQLG